MCDYAELVGDRFVQCINPATGTKDVTDAMSDQTITVKTCEEHACL